MHVIDCRLLRRNATSFLMDDIYRNPGPLQFDGPGADAKPITLNVEDQDYMGRIKKLQEYLEKVFTINTQYFIQRCIRILA
jgi:pyrophosphate--fructose-6-phosphate 1-phosphotransferase